MEKRALLSDSVSCIFISASFLTLSRLEAHLALSSPPVFRILTFVPLTPSEAHGESDWYISEAHGESLYLVYLRVPPRGCASLSRDGF